MPSRARLASLGLTEWYQLGDNVVVTADIADANVTGVKLKDVFTFQIAEFGNTTSGNVYFTNTRAIGAFTAGEGIVIQANGLIAANTDAAVSYSNFNADELTANVITVGDLGANSIYANVWNNLHASNVIEDGDTTSGNVFFSNSRAIGALTAGDNIVIEANGLVIGEVQQFTGNTDQVPEGVSNLYFSNARAVGALTAGENIAIESNGLISVDSNPTFNDLTIQGNLTIDGNVTYLYVQNLEVEDNMLYLNANSNVSNPDLGWAGNYNDGTYRHAGVFRDADDGIFKFFDEYEPEPDASIYIDTANATFHLANVQAGIFIGDLDGNVIGMTTDAVIEGSNLYFSNDRAIGALTGGDGITIEANGLIINSGTGTVTGDLGDFDNVNVTYTLTANSAVIGDLEVTGNLIATLTTDDVIEGDNLYYTNARVVAVINDSNFTTTDNVSEGAVNLYFTNARSIGSLTAGDNITIEANGLIVGDVQEFTGNTDAVPEGTSNLYFTNTRAVGSLTAGDGITIQANGLIISTGSANVAVLLTSETFSGNGSNTDFTMGSSIDNPENILVTINGVSQIPTSDYTVNGTTLEFVTAPVDKANIEVRFFGEADSLIDARGYFSQSIDNASGYAVTSALSTALTAPTNKQYILHSLFVTNIDDSLTGNVGVTAQIMQYNGGAPQNNTNVMIANVLPIDHRMSVELLKKPQILNAGDSLRLQGIRDGVGVNSNVHAYLTYETRSDVNYFGSGMNIDNLDTHMIFNADGTKATIENVRLANYGGGPAAATVAWANSSNVTQAYFCYNLVVPINTTVELLENPKLIPEGGRILVSASAPNAIAVSISGRKH